MGDTLEHDHPWCSVCRPEVAEKISKRRSCTHHWKLDNELASQDSKARRASGIVQWKRTNARWGTCKKCGLRKLHQEREYSTGAGATPVGALTFDDKDMNLSEGRVRLSDDQTERLQS